jgi:hypothetical protein
VFDGFFQLDTDVNGVVIVKNGSSVPTDADAAPAFRVYAGDAVLPVSGSCTPLDTGTITGASNNSPIVITSVAHGRVTGDRVTIAGVLGNTAANGTWTVTALTADTFSLSGSTGNGAYTSGGTWHQTGLYKFSFSASGNNGFVAGQTYTVLVSCTVGGFNFSEQHNFNVT